MSSLRYRRLWGNHIEVFKFVNDQQHEYLKGMFKFNKENGSRGHKFRHIVKHSNSRTWLHQSFSGGIVEPWNKLPIDMGGECRMAGVALATPTLPVPHQHFALLSLLATPTLTCWLILLCSRHTNFGNHPPPMPIDVAVAGIIKKLTGQTLSRQRIQISV